MNAAFVILTSALLGNHPTAAPCNSPGCGAPAPACSSCGSGQSFGHALRGQLTGLFSCNSCNTPAPAAAPAPCAAPASCASCGHGHGGGGNQLLGRLRGMFGGGHHATSTCDSCSTPTSTPAPCDGCGAAPGVAPVPAGAPAGDAAPKKMPDAPPPADAPPKADAPKGDKATSLQPVPEAPLAIPGLNPVINTRPNVIVAPATLRNPF